MNKKRLFIILGLVILSLIIFLLAKKPKTPSPAPTVAIPSYHPFYSSLPKTVTAPSPAGLDQTKKVAVYSFSPLTIEAVKQFFAPIVANLGFSAPPAPTTLNSSPHLVWANQSAYFDVDLQTGQFIAKPLTKTFFADSTVTESQALDLAKNWLQQYQLLDTDANYEVAYLQNSGYELEESPTDFHSPFAYRFYFSPEINHLPIFTASSAKSTIIIDVARQGYIFQINYQLPALFYSSYLTSPNQLQFQERTIKNSQQITQAINTHQATIVSSKTTEGNFAPSNQTIAKVNYQQTKLGYQTSPVNDQFIPVFQLTGTATLNNGSTVKVTAYLPALAD
jgi:hypothetical protein